MGRKKAAAPDPIVEEPAEPEKSVETVEWEGITIQVTYSPHDIMAHAHLQLQVLTPKGAKLPVTDTGYRSHFLPPGIVEEQGGPAAFTLAWLTEEAKSPRWRKQEAASRQLSLF